MMQRKYWKCASCESVSPYKGLCRDCTTYDDNGSVIEPVMRVKHNSDGSVWTPPAKNSPMASKEMLNAFRGMRQKRMTKKQKAQMNAQIKESLKAQAEADNIDLSDLGESVEEE